MTKGSRPERINLQFGKTVGVKPIAIFLYSEPHILTGQSMATEFVIKGLTQIGWDCQSLPIPSFNRGANIATGLARLLLDSLDFGLKCCGAFRRTRSVIYLNLSQSLNGLVRGGLPFICLSLFNGSECGVVSLHGSWFMGWEYQTLQARLFRAITRRARYVTVLGENQRAQLIKLGVPAAKGVVVPNTCELAPLPGNEVRQKHSGTGRTSILYFGNLIEFKGFMEYLGALKILSEDPQSRWEAVLCGKVVHDPSDSIFRNSAEAGAWIEAIIAEINQGQGSRVAWIQGATGALKRDLFQQAQIFVFPSRMEAQPLVLLEAMASGCAIISSRAGEIPSTLLDTGVLLENTDVAALAEAIKALLSQPERRVHLGTIAHNRFVEHFPMSAHLQRWQEIMNEVFRAGDEVRQHRMVSPQRIGFFYCNPSGFSGQTAATESIIQSLASRDWHCRRLAMPAFNRLSPLKCLSFMNAITGMLFVWARLLLESCRRASVIHVTLGQTASAFVREGLPFFAVSFLTGNSRGVISMNGGVFMSWKRSSVMATGLRLFVSRCRFITVVGENQKRRLAALGVPANKILIVPNTCELPVIPPEEIAAKQKSAPVRVLFLSNLIDTKGYVEYLEALDLLSQIAGLTFEAVLCGEIMFSRFCEHFVAVDEATRRIEEKVARINQSQGVRVVWIRGAKGKQKAALFREAHILVFPSRYKVEAQPLVLLEAMASGCAIITSMVGEIPWTVGDAAVKLSDTSVAAVAAALERLIRSPAERLALSAAAHTRFQNNFTLARYSSQWEKIFKGPAGGEVSGVGVVRSGGAADSLSLERGTLLQHRANSDPGRRSPE